MKSLWSKIVFVGLLLPAMLASQTSTQRKGPPSAPAPLPPTSSPQIPVPSAMAPQYSPSQLDFGSLWDGESAKRTFSLTPPAAGTITLSFPGGGLFWLVEYRELGPSNVASKNPGIGALKQVKAFTSYQVGQPVPGFIQYTVAAGSEIQLDFVFQPVSQPKGVNGTVPPGQKSVIMKLSGSGPVTPWSVTIPLRGNFNGAKTQSSAKPGLTSSSQALAQAPPPPASAKSASPQQVPPPGSGSVKAASTTIATVPPKGGGLPGSVSGESQLALTPTHFPDALYFGAVWQGDSVKQTFHFDNTDGGYIHVDTPLPFQVSEIRALTPGGGSKNSGKPQNIPLGPQVKTRVKFTPNQAGPYTALADASTNVEVDVVLQPQLQSATGDKSALMKISGPSGGHDWGMSIPLHGTVAAGLEVNPGQLWAIGNDQGAYVNITVHGVSNAISGTLKGGGVLPPGVSITPQIVNVPASGTFQTTLWLAFNGIPADTKARPLQIVFEAPNHSTSSQIQFIGVPDTALEINSGDRGDCGVSRASLSLRISPPHQYKNSSTKGRRGWVFLGWNYDLLNNRYVEMTANSGGVDLFSHSNFVIRANTSDQVREFSPYEEDFDVTPEKWAKILAGPANFGCRQWDTTSGGAIGPKGPLKWTAAVKGLKF